jgi:uncharacterized protein YbjT (DUF2867 family)
MSKTAIIFGATGLVGNELVFELLESKDYLKVITVARKPLPFSHSKLEQIQISGFDKLPEIKSKLAANVYFCCIGTTIKIAGSQDAFRKVDYDIPVLIAQLGQELSVPAMVIVSSIGADANSTNFYLRTKGEMEQSVKGIFKGNLKIVRPSLLMGHRSEFRFGEKAAIVFMKVLGIFMIGSLKKYRGIYAWDVARAMIKSIGLSPEKVFVESDQLQDLAGQVNAKHNPHEVIK